MRVLQTSGVDVESQHFSATRCQLASQIAAPTTYIHGVVAATGNGGKCHLVIVNVVIPGHWANYGFIIGLGVSGGAVNRTIGADRSHDSRTNPFTLASPPVDEYREGVFIDTMQTIRRRTVLGLATVFATALLTAPVALAGEQDFVLVNKTGVEIHNLHIAPHSSDEWGDDILGKDTLDNDDTLQIKFHRTEKAAKWDLKIADSKGNSLTWENLSLLEISKVTLHYKDGKAWADLD